MDALPKLPVRCFSCNRVIGQFETFIEKAFSYIKLKKRWRKEQGSCSYFHAFSANPEELGVTPIQEQISKMEEELDLYIARIRPEFRRENTSEEIKWKLDSVKDLLDDILAWSPKTRGCCRIRVLNFRKPLL